LEEYIDDQREVEQGVGILDGYVLTGIGSKNSKRGALFF